MALVATRVLVINQQLSFSVTLKRTLEQVGGYDVSPFTSADTALDYLRLHPQDVALVDLTLPDLPGPDVIFRLRTIQPDIAIIAMPRSREVAAIVDDLDLQGIMDVPIAARELIPLIDDAVSHMRDTLPDTAQAAAISDDSETLMIAPPDPESRVPEMPMPPDIPEFSSLDSVLLHMGGIDALPDPETLELESEDTSQTGEKYETSAYKTPPSPIEVVLNVPPDDPSTASRELSLFQKLASEEPPMPPLEENGTVGDLMAGVTAANMEQVVTTFQRDDVSADTTDYVSSLKAKAVLLDPVSTEIIPALMVLETALDETTPLEAFSMNELLVNIQQQASPQQRNVQPLPSWFKESERYVTEPDFLPEYLPELDQTGDYTVQTTQTNRAQNIGVPENYPTDRIELTPRSRPAPPPESLPEELPEEVEDTIRGQTAEAIPSDTMALNMGEAPPYQDEEELEVPEFVEELEPEPEFLEEAIADETGVMEAEEAETFRADFERMGVRETSEQALAVLPSREAQTDIEDPYIAQLALNLTQVSLELTAEATLLACEGKIVAYAGNLPLEDIEDLRDAVADDWEANPEEARIRFITLPSSGKDYMLYSRKTVSEFSLSMVFAGTMPLRVIRRQSDRLTEALASVPEVAVPEPEPVKPAPVSPAQTLVLDEPFQLPEPAQTEILDVGPLTGFTYLWLINDPDMPLDDQLAQAILSGLDSYLTNMGWQIKTFRVHEDYVYLLVDAPAEPPPHEVIHDLMQRSGDFAARERSLNPDTLWADSYLVVTPGRELDIEEVQQFINFARDG